MTYTTSFDGTRIYYEYKKKNTKKPVLVFIHGVGCNSSIWKSYINYFKGYSTLFLDLRGHGKSSWKKISLNHFALDVIAVLKKEKVSQFIPIGHCLGASIILKMSPLIKFKKMILIDPYVAQVIRFGTLLSLVIGFFLKFALSFSFRKRILHYQDYSKHKKTPTILYPFVDLRGTRISTYLASLFSVSKFAPNIREFNQKTLILASTHDILISNRKLAKLKNKNFKTIIIRDTDHLAPIKNPQKYLSVIEEFL